MFVEKIDHEKSKKIFSSTQKSIYPSRCCFFNKRSIKKKLQGQPVMLKISDNDTSLIVVRWCILPARSPKTKVKSVSTHIGGKNSGIPKIGPIFSPKK